MSGFVKQVTDSDDADGFAREIQSQTRRASCKNARKRVEFLATIVKVISGYHKVGRAQRRIGRKQNAVFAVPESMARRFGQRYRFDRLYQRAWLDRFRWWQ